MRRYRTLCVLACSLPVFLSNNATTLGDDFDFDSLRKSVQQTIEQVRPAVVNIGSRGSGFSGVIVSPEGHVLSAAHAVTPGTQYRITLPDGRRLRGIGKGSNPRADCALIKIVEPGDDLPFVSMGDSSSLEANQPCLGLSYPGGQKAGREPIVRFGRVVRAYRTGSMLQSSALMEPGDSGGPLFDLNGRVIGIHSRIGRRMDRNYEVPVNVFREFWNELNREQTFTQAGPPVPRLGIRISRNDRNRDVDKDDSKGLLVTDVVDESRAAKADIRTDDRILKVYGREVNSIDDLRGALVAARDEGDETINAEVLRGEESLEVEVEFDVDRETAPKVALPEGDQPDGPTPQAYSELAALARQFEDLEQKLDDACILITSDTGDEERNAIVGTKVLGTSWVLSKSSAVGTSPEVKVDGESVVLDVVQRDAANDLVLLKAPQAYTAGVDLKVSPADLPMGTFLLTPDGDGVGFVSVVGSPAFRSAKQSSRGYLGVMPATYRDNEGALLNQVMENGAARRAGLLVGDVIIKLNDTMIRSHSDMRNFLSRSDPNATITAILRREEEELTKSITLGAPPSSSRHAADQMEKSVRRDGFTEVLTHDADLNPSKCGGPVFDLDGRFVGLNIARNSRIRSYAIPAARVKEFLDSAIAAELDATEEQEK